MRYTQKSKKSSNFFCLALALIGAIFVVALVCGLAYYFSVDFNSNVKGPDEPVLKLGALRVAYSPEKGELFNALVSEFNTQGRRTTGGDVMQVEAVEMEPEQMIQAALDGRVDVVNPDSSIWLDQIDRAWMAQKQIDTGLIGETARYAISPVVIAVWEDVARSMGYPQKRLGWGDIMTKAAADPSFKWSHPSTSSASGLLATLAMFYAGAGKTRGLTIEDATAESTLEYVSAVQKTVRQYGEGEWAVVQQVIQQGPGYLDAFVIAEQLVIYYNTAGQKGKLVAIYPREGTLWEDHPLALLEKADLRPDQRIVFQQFREFLSGKESQQKVLEKGFRPTDLSIPLSGPSSPVAQLNGVDPIEPQTTLQIPGSSVVEVVRDVWWYTKRRTNVFLVADTSGSMSGDKISGSREAMSVFLDQIKGDQERVGLVTFSSQVNNIIPLAPLTTNRAHLVNEIQHMSAGGDTALLDAVWAAYTRLQQLNDRERINAIVAMTDGQENNSRIWLNDLVADIKNTNKNKVPVVIFCVAYGEDADYDVLEALAEASGGQVRQGDLTTIQDLYKTLSTYF